MNQLELATSLTIDAFNILVTSYASNLAGFTTEGQLAEFGKKAAILGRAAAVELYRENSKEMPAPPPIDPASPSAPEFTKLTKEECNVG